MPYNWTTPQSAQAQELQLWPHQSLPPRGFAAFILATFTLAMIPLFGLLGTKLLWGLLPFLMITLAGMWMALRRNDRDRQILEVLTLTPETTQLTRQNPRGPVQEWECNTYWTKVALHEKGGPVPFYVTLSGSGREVEIGAFLSEDERKDLFEDLDRRLRAMVPR